MCEDDKNKKVEKFIEEHHEHGLECGEKIANIAKELHPDAIAVIPLYRSCIAIEQSEKEKKDGVCTIHSYADPHWCGEEINIETIKNDEFHSEILIQGDRQGPMIIDVSRKEDSQKNEQCYNCEEPIILENDEN